MPATAARPFPDSTVSAFKLLSDPFRLRVLLALRTITCVTDLCTIVGADQPAVSHHLTLLKLGKLIECRRAGKRNYYGLTDRGRARLEFAGTLEG